jgi:polysaccharide export outer membrane protein
LTLAAVLAVICAAVAPAPLIAQSAPADAVDVPLEPGDAIRLAFWREPALSGEYPVDAHGSVVLPYVGERTVTGIAPTTVRAELLAEYANVLANQAVQVSLLRRVRILGAVRSPGLYRVDATMTIADALALAGGLSPNGRLDGVRIVRGGMVIPVDLTSDAPVDGSLHSGDQITVRESGWLARNSAALLGATISALGFLIGQAVF